jgi:hypothetical protein
MLGGGDMVPEKYINLGFEITKFGKHSRVLRFDQKPVFVFDADAIMDSRFIAHICDSYLKISEKRKDLTCIKV